MEKSYFKMLGLTFSSKLEWDTYIISIAKTAFEKTEVFFSEVVLYLCKSTIWPYMEYCCMSGLVLLFATWNCWISYKSGYGGLLVLHLLPLLNPWLIVEM